MKTTYKPPRVSGEFKKGERGEALVKLVKKNNVAYVLVKFVESGKKYRFRRTRNVAKLRPGRWYIALNSDEDEIWAFSPWSGQFTVRVSEFVAKEGEPPTPKVSERKNKDGKPYSTTDFTVLLEITAPENYAGISIPYQMRYNFREATDEEGRSVVGLPDRGTRTKQLVDFLQITGAWNRGPMKWKDNVLPAFEKRILREAKEFNAIVKNGWIDVLFEDLGEPEIEDEDWDDETEVEEPVETSSKDDELDWEDE